MSSGFVFWSMLIVFVWAGMKTSKMDEKRIGQLEEQIDDFRGALYEYSPEEANRLSEPYLAGRESYKTERKWMHGGGPGYWMVLGSLFLIAIGTFGF